jgi:hypothetical protein
MHNPERRIMAFRDDLNAHLAFEHRIGIIGLTGRVAFWLSAKCKRDVREPISRQFSGIGR